MMNMMINVSMSEMVFLKDFSDEMFQNLLNFLEMSDVSLFAAKVGLLNRVRTNLFEQLNLDLEADDVLEWSKNMLIALWQIRDVFFDAIAEFHLGADPQSLIVQLSIIDMMQRGHEALDGILDASSHNSTSILSRQVYELVQDSQMVFYEWMENLQNMSIPENTTSAALTPNATDLVADLEEPTTTKEWIIFLTQHIDTFVTTMRKILNM